MMPAIDHILEQKSIRITPMRQLVLRHFFRENKSFGLSELEEALPKSDRITIYRTLKTFEEKGVLHPIEHGTSEVKYALCKEHCQELNHYDKHPHFHCAICGEVECLESVTVPSVILPQGYSANEIKMNIKGRCNKCQG